jgi:DNA-binding CsgD family transcriptional regulator
MFGMWLRWVDDLDESRRLLERVVREATANGHDTSRAVGLLHLAVTECLAGNLEPAREHASSAFSIATDLDVGHPKALATHALALVDAYVGEVEDARELCEQVRPFATGAEGAMMDLEGTLGLLELSLENYEPADAHLRSVLEMFERVGFGEPGQFRAHADAAEAGVALGDVRRAEEIADYLDEHGERTSHRWSLATGGRVRALVAAARGDLDAALAACERALEHHAELAMPIERARTLLVRGIVERRARRRGAAKESFEQGLEVFGRSGARLWAERAQAELDRVGLRRSAGDELTENERRVAELAASGMTNREIAAALYMSPKTVAANLSRVYRKLGISSRAELGARIGERVQT